MKVTELGKLVCKAWYIREASYDREKHWYRKDHFAAWAEATKDVTLDHVEDRLGLFLAYHREAISIFENS